MVNNTTADAQVGAAWAQLRNGQHDEAITGFEKVLQMIPNHVDAHYGLGLALRETGREADAVESFQKALEIAQGMLDMLRSQAGTSDPSFNELGSTEDDRYMMLTRMSKQRLAELGTKA